jgi:hypothetical protein
MHALVTILKEDQMEHLSTEVKSTDQSLARGAVSPLFRA